MTQQTTRTMSHNVRRLADDLIAGVPDLAPVVAGDGSSAAVFTLTGDGDVFSLGVFDDAFDMASIEPVLAAHDPTPDPPPVIDFVETRVVSAVTRTTDGIFQEIWRLPTQVKHIYRAILEMRATDATDGTTKAQQAVLVFKGLSGSVVQVGTTTVLWSAPDTGTTNWAIQAQVQGTALVFGVRGAAGKTIDWSLEGQIVVFAPGGLEA